VIVVAGLHVALPARYRVPPAWLVPVALLAVLIAGDPGLIDRQETVATAGTCAYQRPFMAFTMCEADERDRWPCGICQDAVGRI
jgi:hypothetical protein